MLAKLPLDASTRAAAHSAKGVVALAWQAGLRCDRRRAADRAGAYRASGGRPAARRQRLSADAGGDALAARFPHRHLRRPRDPLSLSGRGVGFAGAAAGRRRLRHRDHAARSRRPGPAGCPLVRMAGRRGPAGHPLALLKSPVKWRSRASACSAPRRRRAATLMVLGRRCPDRLGRGHELFAAQVTAAAEAMLIAALQCATFHLRDRSASRGGGAGRSSRGGGCRLDSDR